MGVIVLNRLAHLVVRRRRRVLLLSLVAFLVFGAVGGGVADRLSSGGFEDPGAESTKAQQLVDDVFDAASPNVVLLVTAKNGNVDDPATAAAGQALTAEVAALEGVDQAVSYWSLGNAPPLKSKGGDKAIVLVRLSGTEDEVDERIAELSPVLTRETDTLVVGVGGFAEVFRQVGTTIEDDLARAEGVAFPITLVLLIFVFGSAVAAGLPLAIGVISIIGTFFVLFVISQITQVSIFALNLTTAMGLGLSIDYSLFVVSRYREELAKGRSVEAAVVRAVETAGRTVVFSAATVAASLAALLVFPLAFLRSFAYAGTAVVAVAAIASVVVLPAILASLGHRIDKLAVRRRAKASTRTFWHDQALRVMRRPWLYAVSVTALLVVLGLPFIHIRFGLPDDRVLPAELSSRQVQDAIRTDFDSQEAGAASVVTTGIGDPAAPQTQAQIDAYATELSKLDGVSRVDAATGYYIGGQRVLPANEFSARFATAAEGGATYWNVVPSVEPMSAEGEELVADIRDLQAPFDVQVSGMSARLVDAKASIFGRVPLAALIIGLITFAVLFLMFGSVLVPIKAVILNLLSLSATFGAMVWIFQDGHLSGLLGFTPVGYIDTTTPILMFCIAFGLSMDYEVFLLSRIKEEHDRTGDNERSVAVGLEKTGRIVTAAAALLAVVFLAMGTSGVSFIKLFGLGLTMAVLMDATLIRATLVPAFMRLAGEANWWAPAPLKRIYDRWGFSESDGDEDHDLVVRKVFTEGYRLNVLEAAAELDGDGLRELLAQEHLTIDDLQGWQNDRDQGALT
ncbi:MAG TPA: MMPL family transporter [Acidimicrobiales bacterium]|nr:MMPL family transporter [Acidimicrobiales bacterium]